MTTAERVSMMASATLIKEAPESMQKSAAQTIGIGLFKRASTMATSLKPASKDAFLEEFHKVYHNKGRQEDST